MPVREARVVVGIAMDPKVVGTALATRQATMDFRGLKPTATIMAAGMATAVPKPAMPSMKSPKPQARRSASTRISEVTEESMVLMVSMAFVCTTRLYVKIAAVMTRRIGQMARAAPSTAPAAMCTGCWLNGGITARMKEMIAATEQAFHAAIFNTASATISHRMGTIDRAVTINLSSFHEIDNTCLTNLAGWRNHETGGASLCGGQAPEQKQKGGSREGRKARTDCPLQ